MVLIIYAIYSIIKTISAIISPLVLTLCKMLIVLFCKCFKVSNEKWNDLRIPGDSFSPSHDNDTSTAHKKSKINKDNIINYVGKRDRK